MKANTGKKKELFRKKVESFNDPVYDIFPSDYNSND